MKFKIPFTFSDLEKLKKKSKFFSSKLRYRKKSKLGDELKASNIKITREEYLGICLRSFLYSLVVLYVLFTTIFAILRVNNFYLLSIAVAVIFSTFVYFSQRVYPRIYLSRKERDIEKNLLSALEDILVQLNSGIPLFNILTNISDADYGVLSSEFREAVKKINAGEPESEVLESLGEKNPSIFFRRSLWQISNAMRSGSDMSVVIQDNIRSLNEEQMIQIQNYGSRLNPLVVLYMLMSVIIPALSITFLTIISSMINLPQNIIILMFITLFVFDVLAQVMFLGLIKSKRPSLL